MVYGAAQKTLYITSGSSVLRYSLSTKKFLSPIDLGGDLSGIDLSADGKTLAVADTSLMSLILINLSNLKITELPIAPGQDEVGIYDVSWGADKMVYASGALPPATSGWVALRKINPVTGQVKIIGSESVTNQTVLRASPDRTVIGFAQGAISDGRWGTINTKTGVVTMRDGSQGTGTYNKDIGVARQGVQLTVATVLGDIAYNKSFSKLGVLAVPGVGFNQVGNPYRTQQLGTLLDGIAYSPKSGNISAGLPNSNLIEVFNPANLKASSKVTVNAAFPPSADQPFSDSILRYSPDGTILFFTVPGGIDYISSN